MISLSQRFEIALVCYTSIELTCGTLIMKRKNPVYAYSVVSRVFIYAPNKPLFACCCKQTKTTSAKIK